MTITADACEASGLAVAGPHLVDLGGLAEPEAYRDAVERALEDPEVDALIAIFLSVSELDRARVGRGIRRAIVSAQLATGVSKPVLLCFLGETGVLDLDSGGADGDSEKRAVVPSYRFPESAARALGHAAAYSAYRREPAGRLLWFEDVDPAAARARLEEELADAAAGSGPHWLEGERAGAVLACFGIRVGPRGGTPGAAEPLLQLTVRSHPDFGPLISLQRAGLPSVARITPLTDRDARWLLEALGVPPGGAEVELLGRISQLVDEMPWLVEVHADLEPPAEGRVALGHGVRIAFLRPA